MQNHLKVTKVTERPNHTRGWGGRESTMKKTVTVALILALFLLLVGVAIVAAPRPPARVCLQWEGSNVVMPLVIKKAGRALLLQDGRLNFYAIHGEMQDGVFSVPFEGTGYVSGTTFRFGLEGKYLNTAGPPPVIGVLYMEGTWDLETATGVLYSWEFQSDGDSFPVVSVVLSEIPCSDIVIPFAAGSAGSFAESLHQ